MRVIGNVLRNNSRICKIPWEHDENRLISRNKNKTKKNSKRKKTRSIVSACWAFSFQNCFGGHSVPPKIPPKLSNILCIYLTFFIWMQQKMQVFNVNRGNEQLWKEKFHAPNGKAQHALTNGPVSFFLKWGRGFFVFSPFVPNVFPSCSHGALIKFPKCSQ